jgi:hypothetical protein
MEADDILRTRSLINRRLYQQRIADAAEAQLEQSQPTSYLNFDASTGLARLQDVGGNIVYGAAQTNGAIGNGESIRLRRGGVFSKYDAMPWRKPESNTEQIINNIYRVKTLFYLYNTDGIHLDFYIGGDRSQPIKILSIDNITIGYITNLGINKYLASAKYIEAGLRKYLFKSNGTQSVAISNPVVSGDEYYLGNGLWDSNSGSPNRSMIHDLAIYSFPVSLTETALYDSYGQALSHNQVDAYAETWTPENPNSRFTFNRELVSFANDDTPPPDPLRGSGVSYAFNSTISFSFTYPDETYTFTNGVKSQLSITINESYLDADTGATVISRAIFYYALIPVSNAFPNNVASVPPQAYYPGEFTWPQSYNNWLTSVRSAGISDTEQHNSDGTTTITHTFSNGTTNVYGFIPTPPIPFPPYIPPIVEESYIETYSGSFLAQKTVDGYISQNWMANRTINIGKNVSSNNANILAETSNILTFKANTGTSIILNNDDFLVISSGNTLSPITEDSTSFTIVALQAYNEDFNVNSAIGLPILFGQTIDGFPALIKGTIASASYSLSGALTVNVAISKILLKTYSSFLNSLITDNGSYYSYHFRKKIPATFGAFVNKSILKVIPLNPIVSTFLTDSYVVEINGITGINLQTDNIVNQTIYSVVNTSGSNATIEQWNILANGDVKYGKVFTTPYCQIPKNSIIFGSSFY